MQLVEGTDLASEIRKGPLEPRRAVIIVQQVAAALAAAHQEGLRHRDVKPSNILLVPGYERGRDHAWLFDWGIAQLIDITSAPVTRNGQIVGTPSYIAPERLRGGGSDHRADVYSLAVVLYECLVGRTPFDRDDVYAILSAHLHTKPPKLPSHLPDGLRAVVAKGLAKSPDERYGSAPAMAEAARAALDGWNDPQPTPVAPPRERGTPPAAPTRVSPVDRRVGRFRGPAVGASIGSCVAVGLLAFDLIDLGHAVVDLAVPRRCRNVARLGLRPTPPGAADAGRVVMARYRGGGDRGIIRVAAIVMGIALVSVVGWKVFEKNTQATSEPPCCTPCATGRPLTEVLGVIGSEKEPFLRDERVSARFACNGLKVTVASKGSREMLAALKSPDHGYDFAFPSSTSTAD
jgi:hypothetical protein